MILCPYSNIKISLLLEFGLLHEHHRYLDWQTPYQERVRLQEQNVPEGYLLKSPNFAFESDVGLKVYAQDELLLWLCRHRLGHHFQNEGILSVLDGGFVKKRGF